MERSGDSGARRVLERLHRAMNDHDLEAFLANFDADYRSEQPAHPERAFGGRAQVEENWGSIFREIPDFRADVVAAADEDGTLWAEWAWHGTRRDGSPLEMRGVTLFGTRDERIVWGRLYVEMVERTGEDIRQAMKRMTGAGAQAGDAARTEG